MPRYEEPLPATSNNYNPNYANNSPDIYAAVNAGKPTPDELFQVSAMQFLQAKHAELNNMSDVNKARKRFAAMSPAVRDSIKEINPDFDYQTDPSFLMRQLKEAGSTVKDLTMRPFQFAMGAIEGYVKTAIYMPYNISAGIEDSLKAGGGKAALEYVTTLKSWKTAWTGEDNWREEDVATLDSTYGKGLSALVRGQIDGSKPGDIYREYGKEFNLEMQRAISAASDYNAYLHGLATNQTDLYPLTTNGEAYKNALAAAKGLQKEFGNDMYRFLNKTFAPNDVNALEFLAVSTFLNFFGNYEDTVKGGMASKKVNEWRITNPNPLSKVKVVDPSDVLQFNYEFFADPLTYLTFGGSKGLGLSAKLIRKYEAGARAGVSNEVLVGELFKNKRFAKAHDDFAKTLSELRDARKNNDPGGAFAAREKIKQKFGHYDNDITLGVLLRATVHNKLGKEVLITDVKTMEEFYKTGEFTNYITHGYRNNIGYFNDNHLMLARSSRLGTDKIRNAFEKLANGLDSKAPNGIMAKEDLDSRIEVINKAFKDKGQFDVGDLNLDPLAKETLDSLTKHGNVSQKIWNKSMAAHPAKTTLHTSDELIDSSMAPLRDFMRVLTGDKAMANLLSELYITYSPADRFNFIFSSTKFYMDKVGLSLSKQREILEKSFGSKGGFGPVPEYKTPSQAVNTTKLKVPQGPSQPLHLTEGVEMPDFNTILEELYKESEFGPLKFVKALSYSNFAKIGNGLWTLLSLFPKIGAKASADEAVVNVMTNSWKSIFNILTRQGAKVSAAQVAFSGSDKTMGLVKSKLYPVVGKKSPAKYISSDERLAMQADVKILETTTLPSGRVVNKNEIVTAEEFHGATYNEQLAARSVAGFAGNLSPQTKKYVETGIIINSEAQNAQVNSLIARTFSNSSVDGSVLVEQYGKSEASLALDAAHIKATGWGEKFRDWARGTDKLRQTGNFKTFEYALLSQKEKSVFHYINFWKYFSKNVWTHKPTKVTLDYGSTFVRHNAIRTFDDSEAFVDDLMQQIGFIRNEVSQWVPRNQKAKEVIGSFLDVNRQTELMRKSGATNAEMVEALFRNSRDELYTIFHGSADVFNENLLNLINFKMNKGIDKAQQLRRSSPSLDKWAESQYDIAKHIGKISWNEFEEVTAGYGIVAKEVTSDINFKSLIKDFGPKLNIESVFQRLGQAPWEMMDRQITDLYRTDAYWVKVIENRERLAPAEKAYVETLISRGIDPDVAAKQADIWMANQANTNALYSVMQYADNPEVRSQLAWTLRGVGRFNRANEDFWRRFVLVVKDKGLIAAWRLEHYQIALEGTGFVHTDDKGNKYVIIPNDGVMFTTLNHVFSGLGALFSPLNTAKAVATGNFDTIFKQPEWNAKTLKFSMINPSYSDSAGVVSLHGPTASISVAGLKKIFKFGGQIIGKEAAGEKIAEELDNFILGPMNDNLTVSKMFPSAVSNTWALLDTEHKTGTWANTILQAATMMQYNDTTRITPQDMLDEAKVRKYYDRLGIVAYNIIAIKAGFNLLSPIPMGDTTDGINPLLRAAGIVTFAAEFNDILRAVLEVNAETGYTVSDPIVMAVSMFTGSFPDRLVVTVSKDSQGAKLYASAVKETKNWAIDNKKMIETYGSASFIFSPNPPEGEWNPYVVKYLEASGIIEPKNNPFIADKTGDTPITRAIKELAQVKERNQYFGLLREYTTAITDPNNPRRSDPTYRAELMTQVKYQQTILKEGNPMLAYTLNSSTFNSIAVMKKNFNALKSLVNNPDFASVTGKPEKGKIKPKIQEQIKLMTNIATTMLMTFNDKNIRNQPDGIATLNGVYKDGIENLTKLSIASPYASKAYQNIIKPLLDDSYSVPTEVK